MSLALARFLAIVLTALALAPGLAHVLELPHKIVLDRQDYLVVQGLYRGWSLLGIVLLGALATFLALCAAAAAGLMTRERLFSH